ncbi:serine/threonine-protein kinase [Kineobactrum salinum]|uniref:Protein kinase n=1 Tax=Kineobactrum salinum TaxID=2708301 RepID=A0A6C0U4K9_9GAMM|nr:serine/threonine-protein kinase [Kineobactrum salinum]QIB65927.1 protein kinase [Kineobactrum salinum]
MDYPDIPGYKIDSILGEGGMATIYLAEQESFGRRVALKVMSPRLLSDASFGERFLREARIVAQLTHPNFVPVYEVGRHGDYRYMSMEYLPGGDLKSLMRQGLPLADSIRIVKDVASALHYAAGKNFIHRDIKPANILMRENGSPVVCDFGIARQTDIEEQMTLVGTVIGTPHYMSPEQAQAKELDGRSDLYSLGAIFYEMLTGRRPYDSASVIQVSIMHVTEPIPELPGELAAFQFFIEKAMAKLPDNRFQSGMEFIYALEELEEEHYELIHRVAPTQVLSEADFRSKLGASGMRTPVSALSTDSAARRRVRPSRTGMSKSQFHGWRGLLRQRSWQAGSGAVGLLLIVAAGGWWMAGDETPTEPPPLYTPPVAGAGLDGKVDELKQAATLAMTEGRLYGSGEDNAQHYLTSLLIFAPDDTEARLAITRLFGMYLEQAGDMIAAGEYGAATEVLNYASQINFHIEDQNLLEQQNLLRRELFSAQQQSIVAASRSREIKRLLDAADSLFAEGKLTSPAGDNVYDKYQQVLSIDPDNETARAGIQRVAGRFLSQARDQTKQGEFGRARAYMSAAVQIFPQHPDMADTRQYVAAEEERSAERLLREREQESAAVRRELEQRRQELAIRARKIQTLLAAAAADIEAQRLNAPAGNNAVEKYNAVLELDPANVDALNGFEDIARRHIALARDEIGAGRLDDAERNLISAKILSPSNPQYAAVQNELIAARDRRKQEQAAEEARRERVAALLAGAAALMEKGNLYLPRGGNAATQLREVLALEPRQPQALALRRKLAEQLENNAAAEIASGQLDQARMAIDALAAIDADAAQIAALRRRLEAQQQQVQRQQQLAAARAAAREQSAVQERPASTAPASRGPSQALLARAGKLGAVSQSNYGELADIYLKVQQQGDSPAASRGLKEVATYLAGLTREANRARDYRAAQDYLDQLQRIAPEAAIVGTLREEVAYAERQHQEAVSILSSADAIIATPYKKPGIFGNNAEARKTLRTAYDRIVSARQLDADNPALRTSETKLLKKYADIVALHLADKHLDEAREFLQDLAAMELPGGQLGQMEQQLSALETELASEDKAISISSF